MSSETTDFTGGHIDAANRIFQWNIDSNGGALLNEQGVAIIDRMVAALISISNGWCADPKGVARRALTGE